MGARTALPLEKSSQKEENPSPALDNRQISARISEGQNQEKEAKSFDEPASISSSVAGQKSEPDFEPAFEPAFIPVFSPAFPVTEEKAKNHAPNKPLKKTESSLQEKILEAQRIQAENQKKPWSGNRRTVNDTTDNTADNPDNTLNSIPPNAIPIDAENIINLPLQNIEDNFDYADEEERLNTQMSAHTETMQTLSSLDLFSVQHISEEEKEDFDWHAFMDFCGLHDFPEEYIPLLQGLNAVLTKSHCYIKVSAGPQATIFSKMKNQLETLLCAFLQRTVKIQSTIVAYEFASDDELREKALQHPQIQMLMREFGAEINRCYDIRHDRKN